MHAGETQQVVNRATLHEVYILNRFGEYELVIVISVTDSSRLFDRKRWMSMDLGKSAVGFKRRPPVELGLTTKFAPSKMSR